MNNVYAQLGIDFDKLGCVMLNLQPQHNSPRERGGLPRVSGSVLFSGFDPEWAYVSPNIKHVKGITRSGEYHTTLKFGLLENANRWRGSIADVLSGWEAPDELQISSVTHFESHDPFEPYVCIVGLFEEEWGDFDIYERVHPTLQEAHDRLSKLPHIDTFLPYKAHVTLGYFKTEFANEALNAAHRQFDGATFDVVGLDYGRCDHQDYTEMQTLVDLAPVRVCLYCGERLPAPIAGEW